MDNIDYKAIICSFASYIVSDFSNVDVKVNEEEKNVFIYIIANSADIARLIGKEGKIANSLREIMNVVGKDNGKFVHVYFKDKNENIKNVESSKNIDNKAQ